MHQKAMNLLTMLYGRSLRYKMNKLKSEIAEFYSPFRVYQETQSHPHQELWVVLANPIQKEELIH